MERPAWRTVLLVVSLAAGCSSRVVEMEPAPDVYDRCMEIGPSAEGEHATFVLEWSLLPLPHNQLQLAFHGGVSRGFVGVGFEDGANATEIVLGDPEGDIPCVRAMYDTGSELNSDGIPYNFDVEVPGQHVEADGYWSHVRVQRNLSIGATADPYADKFHVTVLWALRSGAVVEGTCQDLSLVDSTTERATFDLDLMDAAGEFRNPVPKKLFGLSEPRCNALPSSRLRGAPIRADEELLTGEGHQNKRIATLLFGASTSGEGGSFALKSGEAPPSFNSITGYVRGGEGGNAVCQASLSVLYGRWSGFTDPIGGIVYYTISLKDAISGDILLSDVDVGPSEYIEYETTLTRNTTVQLLVSAYNYAGLKTTASSRTFTTLNGNRPMFATLYNGPNDGGVLALQQGYRDRSVRYWGETTAFEGWWEGFAREDTDSKDPTTDEWTQRPVSYAIGRQGEASNSVLAWTETLDSQFRATGIAMVHGDAYYFTVRATNCAEQLTDLTPTSFIVDGEPPLAGYVEDGADRQGPLDTVFANWDFFSDTTSGLRYYEWAIGFSTSPATTEVLGWTDVGLLTRVESADYGVGDLRDYGVQINGTIFVHVRAYDKVGWSTTASSDGVIVEYS
ncbi:hypothetical protein DIPPA_10689 [Diplonema papillatum]|nr:hypothetical protein DIPPA_10689 [Diplonema papillatum]